MLIFSDNKNIEGEVFILERDLEESINFVLMRIMEKYLGILMKIGI